MSVLSTQLSPISVGLQTPEKEDVVGSPTTNFTSESDSLPEDCDATEVVVKFSPRLSETLASLDFLNSILYSNDKVSTSAMGTDLIEASNFIKKRFIEQFPAFNQNNTSEEEIRKMLSIVLINLKFESKMIFHYTLSDEIKTEINEQANRVWKPFLLPFDNELTDSLKNFPVAEILDVVKNRSGENSAMSVSSEKIESAIEPIFAKMDSAMEEQGVSLSLIGIGLAANLQAKKNLDLLQNELSGQTENWRWFPCNIL